MKIKKKSFQLACKGKFFKTICRNFLKINGSQDIELLVILRLRKSIRWNVIINKTPMTKNQENFTHPFEDNYLTNHHTKILQNRSKP